MVIVPSLVHGSAADGVIRGRVDVRRAPPLGERRPNVADLGTPARRDLPDRLRSVVYLETAPRGAFEQTEPARAVMDQRNETFVPHVLAITTGTTVDFPNSDRIYHNVFSLSKATPFDLGRYAAGESKSVRFDRPGIVRVFCEIHSHMSAFILVFSHPLLRRHRHRGPLSDRQRAARHLQRRRVERRRRVGAAAGHRCPTAARRSWIFARPMTISLVAQQPHLSASALLAVLSIGVAIYLVSVARRPARPKRRCSARSSTTGTLVDQLRTTRTRDASR